MTVSPKDSPPVAEKPSRSVLGLLFNPQLGATVKPLGDSTRIFLHLLASVFSLYGLIPKDYPGLRDENARMSLGNIMGTAWKRLRFDREGIPKVGLFFAVLGLMVFALVAAVSAFFSVFVGHAHAQAATSEFILPAGGQDIAQAWIDYLFTAAPLPLFNATGTYVVLGTTLQKALIAALAFYSDAMLIIAAMILFYHLSAMVLETAHHGQVMGKRANQMWAPIRLVIAIGLLVPVTAGGLNSGQYIVVKMAEVGSALATNGWNVFLDQLTAYAPNAVPPMGPLVSQIAADMISNYACAYDWNKRVKAQTGGGPPPANGNPQFNGLTGGTPTNLLINSVGGGPIDVGGGLPGSQCTMTVSGHLGIKYSFTPGNPNGGGTKCSAGDLPDQDVCGWVFIPNAPTGTDPLSIIYGKAYTAEQQAFTAALPGLFTVATDGNQGIAHLLDPSLCQTCTAFTQPIIIDSTDVDAIVLYQIAVGNSIQNLAQSMAAATTAAIAQLQPYGWVFAGALLPTVARIQGAVSNAATAGMPETHPPAVFDPNKKFDSDHPTLTAALGEMTGAAASKPSGNFQDPRANVTQDMMNFMVLNSKAWAQTQSPNLQNAQCAAMIGLQDGSQDSGKNVGVVNAVFSLVDRLAQESGVWNYGTGTPCAPNSAAAGLTTFNIGIQQITGGDPLAELAALGHANIDTAFKLMEYAFGGPALAGALQGGGLASGLKSLQAVGGIAQAIIGAAGPILGFLATIFLASGFTLAFVLPLFPFTRFFFAVVVWIAAILEAVVAVPLIALAHLNPEGEGLPGNSARHAYFYVFNIMLRPILMIFGLVCGLLLFLMAVIFLTYSYNLAVAASGGTAYGHEMMSKVIYTIMYVAMMYVCANHSFQLIDHIPEKALSWMGAQAQSMANVGNAQHLANTESLVSSYLSQNAVQGNSAAATQIQQALKDTGGALASKQTAAATPGNRPIAPPAGGGAGSPPAGGNTTRLTPHS